jgi:hypothetical protein
MDTQPAFGFKELLSHVVGDMAKAVSERNGESKQQQSVRAQAAIYAIMGFLPRDVIEAMIAGHCVMLHELMTDSIRDTLTGEVGTTRRATRSGIVAMDNAFGGNLARLERYRLRPSEGSRNVAAPLAAKVPVKVVDPAIPAAATPEVVISAVAPTNGVIPAGRTPIVETRAAARPTEPTPDAGVSKPVVTAPAEAALHTYKPSAAAIAACRANPEAMAALDAGDPLGFARAMGIDVPAEEY